MSGPVLLERREVGRKTPRDGRLELTAASAARLRALGGEFPVLALGREDVGRLEAMDCTCGKGGGEGPAHTHHFAASPLFRELGAGDAVRIELDEARGALRVEPA
jgi:hypothetical protein